MRSIWNTGFEDAPRGRLDALRDLRRLDPGEWARDHDEASGFACFLAALLTSAAAISWAAPGLVDYGALFAVAFSALSLVIFVVYVSVMLRWVRGYWGP